MSFPKRILVFAAVLVAYYPTISPSQEDDSTAESPRAPSAYDLTAGDLQMRQIGGERVIVLSEGVRITHGDVVVTSRQGRQYTDRRVTHLSGDVEIDQRGLLMKGDEGEYRRFADTAMLRHNVEIIDNGWHITCDEATFTRTTEQAWLVGNVRAVDSTSTLLCDTLFYDKRRNVAEVFGRVSLENADEGIEAQGKHGFYYRGLRQGIIDDTPHLIVDPDSPEPATVDGDTMWFYPDDNRAVAAGRVKIIKGNTVTQCDSAVVIDDENRVELYGRPLAKQDNVSMEGDRMLLHYTDDEVDQIALVGTAAINETAPDTLVVGQDNWIRGDSMTLYLHDNRIDSIQVTGSAVSEYYTPSPGRIESNYITGREMFFRFERDSLSYVNFVGNAKGVYRYIDLDRNQTVDSLRALSDTSLVYLPFDQEAEIVAYLADSIEYYAKRHDLVLDGNAEVDYQKRKLLGEHIIYNADLELLDATGKPELIEGKDKFYGDQMDYDLGVGVGLVREGWTKFLDGFYRGENIAKTDDNVLKVWNSSYTTCDRKNPHYHFRSNQMKVYLDDKIVSGPIFLYIGETPIAYLPFFAQNIRRGRRSGILRPDFEFGITNTGTRFIRDVGYYWATNDYTDFLFSGDFNEDESVRVRINNRYRLRYLFDGAVNFSFLRDLDDSGSEWTLSSNHNQTLGERFTLTANLRFVSSDEAQRAVSNLDEVANIIDRRIESRVSLRKSWENVGFSASARRVENLDVTSPTAVKVDTELPNISLSIPSRTLFFGQKTTRGDKPVLETVLDGVRYSPGFSFNRQTRERLNDFTETITSNQSLNFSSPRRIGFLNVSPTLSLRNQYTRTAVETDATIDIDSTQVNTPFFFGTLRDTMPVPANRTVDTENAFRWTTGANVSTNLYGTFYPGIGPLRGVRHTFSPSARYAFQPSIDGRPSTQSISVSANNSIDLKVRGKGDEEDRKLSGVLIWALSSAYNPDAPSRRGWSTISSRINTQLLGTRLSLNHSIDPYQFEILTTSFTSSFGLQGTHNFGKSLIDAKAELNPVASDTVGSTSVTDLSTKPDPDVLEREKAGGLGWNVNGSFSYSNSRFGDPQSTLNASGNIDLTRAWRASYNATYNVEARTLSGQRISLHRDLHCWEISFTRQQLGDDWEFYFRINLLSHPEIYAERGRRGLGSSGGVNTPFRF